jgi:fatty-acyl-CoA synthase
MQVDNAWPREVARARRQSIGDLLRRTAVRHPDRLALREGLESRTYFQLDREANQVANALSELGVIQGDRVAIVSRNSLDYVRAIFAVARLGAVLVPINFMLNAAEVGYILTHSRSVGLLVQDGLLTTATEAAEIALSSGADLRYRISIGTGHASDWVSFATLLAHRDTTEPDVEIRADDAAQVMYTSGTESRPKGAILSHDAFIAQYAGCLIDGEMDASDVDVHAMPLYHCAQQHCFLLPDILVGASGVILSSPEPAKLLETIESERVTKIFAPPTVWIAMLRHQDFHRRDLSSLRKGYYGAAIMPVEILHEIGLCLPSVRLWNFYGQTEMAPMAVVLGPEDQIRKAGAAGRASLSVETRVVDRNGATLPVGEVGEIVHRSPQAFLGYLDDDEKTNEAFRGGWFHSGDLGVFDDEGYLTVVDRIKDMIKTGGENVASREVEEIIYEHSDVAEVAVIGLAHPTWIEAVVALVVLRPGVQLSREDLAEHCRKRMAGYKVPKAFEFVQALPKNASGKLLKRALREQFAHLSERIPRTRLPSELREAQTSS